MILVKVEVITNKMQTMAGRIRIEMDVEVLEVEGLSPKPVVVPPGVGLLAFKTVGEVPEPPAAGAAPDVDAVVGVLADGDEEENDA